MDSPVFSPINNNMRNTNSPAFGPMNNMGSTNSPDFGSMNNMESTNSPDFEPMNNMENANSLASNNNGNNVRQGNLAMILNDLENQAAAGAGRPENVYHKYNTAAKNYDGMNGQMAQNIRAAGVIAARKLNANFVPKTKNNVVTKTNQNGGRSRTRRVRRVRPMRTRRTRSRSTKN